MLRSYSSNYDSTHLSLRGCAAGDNLAWSRRLDSGSDDSGINIFGAKRLPRRRSLLAMTGGVKQLPFIEGKSVPFVIPAEAGITALTCLAQVGTDSVAFPVECASFPKQEPRCMHSHAEAVARQAIGNEGHYHVQPR